VEFFSQLNVATCCKSTLYTIQRVWANNIIWSYWLRMQVGISSSLLLCHQCFGSVFIFFRIRIQSLMLKTNTDPDPDPIQIQGFNEQKLKKNYSWQFFFFFDQNLQFTYPLASIKKYQVLLYKKLPVKAVRSKEARAVILPVPRYANRHASGSNVAQDPGLHVKYFC